MRRLSFHVGAVALSALAIAGCGGGDDGDTTEASAPPPIEEPAALSKEELIAQGDAICAEVNAAVGTLAATEADGGAAQAAELYGGMVERLKDLGKPSDDTAGYSEFVAAGEELAQAESDVDLAAERGEEEGLAAAEAEASSALSAFQSAATAYGFEQCGEGPSAPASGSPDAPVESEEAESLEEGVEEEEAEVAPEVEEEVAPETGGAGSDEGGGAEAGGGTEGGGEAGGGGSSGGVGPG